MTKSKWWEVYTGDRDRRVFVGEDGRGGLCRVPHGAGWRTLSARADDEAGLTTAEVEVMLARYVAMRLVLRRGDGFAYWEFVAPSGDGERSGN